MNLLIQLKIAPASISVTTLGSSSNSDHLSCSTGFDEFPTISTEPISHSEILPFAWESVSGALFFIFFLILFTWLELFQKDPFSSARNKLRHYRPISSFKFLTLASIAAILSLIVQEAIVIISKTRFINAFDYNPVFNDKNLVGRLFAFISLPALFLLLLPISKHSIFHLLIGIPLDSAVKWHTYIASFASICMIIHGSLFLERLSNSPLGVKVAFGSEYPYSILPGFVAWIMIIIGWTTSVIEPIRRRYWDLWMSYHSLLIIALLLLMLHAKATIPYLIFGLVFYGVDKIFYVATLLYFPSKISYIKTIEDVNGDYVLVKMKRKNILSKMNPYSPGKIVHLGVRQIGFFSHPFSIVDSVPIKEDETEITLLSKVVRSNYAKRKTWTEKYLELVKLGKLKAGDQVTFYGPYSTSTVQFINYERIVLFAAGSGITPMIYIMSYVLKHKSSKLNHVTLVWTTRDAKVVDALLSHISPPPGTEKDLEIEVKLYLTGESDCNSFEHHQSITLKVNLGRPKIDEIFEEIESKVRSSNEKIALAVCGAENFTDEVVRRASKQPRNSSEQQCEFHLHREGFAL